MLSRWQQLNLRDQAMLVLLAAALVIYALYQIAFRPLAAANARLTVQNTEAARSLEATTRLAAEYRELQSSGAHSQNLSENLTQLIDRTVASNNLHMSRFQPGSQGDVQVRLDNASFDQVLRWLNELESSYAISIKEMAVSPGSGSGLVNLSVRLYRP